MRDTRAARLRIAKLSLTALRHSPCPAYSTSQQPLDSPLLQRMKQDESKLNVPARYCVQDPVAQHGGARLKDATFIAYPGPPFDWRYLECSIDNSAFSIKQSENRKWSMTHQNPQPRLFKPS